MEVRRQSRKGAGMSVRAKEIIEAFIVMFLLFATMWLCFAAFPDGFY